MHLRLTRLIVFALLGVVAARAEPVSRPEVLAAIAVLEHDITAPEAVKAATTVMRFGKESNDVLITVGLDTMPWMRTDVSRSEARVREMLMAAYCAGDIKSQLAKRRAEDDPYRGWLAVIKAYRQIRQKQPEVRIPEVEELIEKEQAGVLRQEADELRRQQQRQEQQNMI